MYFQRLEDLRVDADLTQEQVAQVLHCKREVYRATKRESTSCPSGRLLSWRSSTEQVRIIFWGYQIFDERRERKFPPFYRVDAPLNIKLVKLTIMARKVCEKCDIDGNSVDII